MLRLRTGVMCALTILLALPLRAHAETAEAELLSNVRQLTYEGKRAGEGYFSADGNRLVFQSERDPANPFYQIYLLDLETGDVDKVSPGIGKTTCAWIHPDDERVLYASTHQDPEAANKMQAELDFRASGQTRRYAWDYDENFDIFAQELSGGEPINLTAVLGYDAEGAYSPDGTKIVFASNRRAYSGEMRPEEAEIFEHDKSYMMDIYIMNADGSGVRRLTNAPGYDGGPFFSADGKQITWRRFSRDGATAEIFTMDLATGEERQLTRMGVMSWAPYFHPSGDYLIFASNREGFANFELFLVAADGDAEPIRVTYTDGFDGLPVFSPDGGRLSWTSRRGSGEGSQIFMAGWNDQRARELLGLAQASAANSSKAASHLTNTDAAITPIDAQLHVEHLASEEMAGRLTGTEGELLATEYVASVFADLGLEPGGENGTYYQAFDFTSGVTLGDNNGLSINQGEKRDVAVLDRDWRPLAFSSLGSSSASGVVFAGYGIVAPGAGKVPAYDSYGDLDVTDKWVLMFRFQPESVPPEWRRHLIHYSDLPYKASVAKRRGAKGIVVVTGPNAQARDRLVELRFESGAAGQGITAISLSDEKATQLMAAIGKDLAQIQQGLDKGEATDGFEIPDLGFSAHVDIERENGQGRNVIAWLKSGEDRAEAPIILGAHVDHLGRGETSGSLAGDADRNQVHYGADDNASGVAALLEVAQYLSALSSAGKLGAVRDVGFAAWSGEELGTLGSTHFVTQSADANGEDKRFAAAYLNMDMIGHLRDEVFVQGVGSSSVWPGEIERRNVPVGLPLSLQSDPYLPTDVTPFYLKGVPVLNFFTGAHEDYSTPRDTPDKLNYQGISDIARLVAGLARSTARNPQAPDYVQVERKSSDLGRKHLRAYLGTIPAYGQDEALKGVKLQGAVKDGPAERAGVMEGDLVVELAGVPVETIQDYMGALSGLKAGEETSMVVVREGVRTTLKIVPGARE